MRGLGIGQHDHGLLILVIDLGEPHASPEALGVKVEPAPDLSAALKRIHAGLRHAHLDRAANCHRDMTGERMPLGNGTGCGI